MMRARPWPQTLLLVTLGLGLFFSVLHWLLKGMALTPHNVGKHLLVALVFALWQVRSNGWFARLRRNDYAGWQRVAAGGRGRFLFAYGLSSKGMALACMIVGMNWAYSGAIPSSDRLMNDGMIWTVLGVLLAARDWKQMQQGAAQVSPLPAPGDESAGL